MNGILVDLGNTRAAPAHAVDVRRNRRTTARVQWRIVEADRLLLQRISFAVTTVTRCRRAIVQRRYEFVPHHACRNY